MYFERFNSMDSQGNIKVSENKFTVRRSSSVTNETRYQTWFADTEKMPLEIVSGKIVQKTPWPSEP